jgi:hypothetical protein
MRCTILAIPTPTPKPTPTASRSPFPLQTQSQSFKSTGNKHFGTSSPRRGRHLERSREQPSCDHFPAHMILFLSPVIFHSFITCRSVVRRSTFQHHTTLSTPTQTTINTVNSPHLSPCEPKRSSRQNIHEQEHHPKTPTLTAQTQTPTHPTPTPPPPAQPPETPSNPPKQPT